MAEKKLTIEKSMRDFKRSYESKAGLIKREEEDFLFALGKQWSDEDLAKLKGAGVKPTTDNLIQPNIFLLTGLERQNRSEFRAFPEGQEDGIKAEIASGLLKHSVKISDFQYKSSDQFKDGTTCGESHLELYLDYTYNLLNGKPCWKKADGASIFPEPGCREYDYSDARFVYKLTRDLGKDDLIALYPEKKRKIEESNGGRFSLEGMGSTEAHRQQRDYPTEGKVVEGEDIEEVTFDLLERYYKKYVEAVFVGDRQTGKINQAESEEKAQEFIAGYQGQLQQEQAQFEIAKQEYMRAREAAIYDPNVVPGEVPSAPQQKDPNRFIVIKRQVPEVWCFAHAAGIADPLADERAWFFPKWKSWPIIPFHARFSTAPLTGDNRHLLIQGVVHGVKGAQEKRNKSETLLLRHLNSSTNSGWLAEEDAWVDSQRVEQFGTVPGVNLEYKTGKPKPERIYPMQLSAGHLDISRESAESIKQQLGINADLLAVQQGGSDSGRAIALRQKQGLLMVQELFDNLSRTKQLAGRLLLSQLGEIYDTETAKEVLGEAFLRTNFPPLMMKEMDPATGQIIEVPMKDAAGQPMPYDSEMAEVAIAEVLAGDLWEYDVAVGEAVASETMKIANSMEIKDFAATFPGLIPPQVLIEESQLPETTKAKVMSAIENAQAQAQAMQQSAQPQAARRQ